MDEEALLDEYEKSGDPDIQILLITLLSFWMLRLRGMPDGKNQQLE